MDRFRFLKSLELSVPLLALPYNKAISGIAALEEKLPNIVIILADDMGFGDPGCYKKDSKISTPCMDRLAAEGAKFTDAHSPSGFCSPTRYGLLTGR